MKLVFFDDFKLGAVKGDNVVDLSGAVGDLANARPQYLLNRLIEDFDQRRGALEAIIAEQPGTPIASVRLRSPVPKPNNIVAMAVNYMEDGTRDEPAPINAFHKAGTAVIGDGDTMVLPDVPATIFEGEAEMAFVIGKTADNVKAEDAYDHIFGYLNFIDGSARGLPPAGNTFFQMKSRDTFAPMGPYLVTADEVADPMNLQVQLTVNGDLKQNFNTNDMAHDIARCVEWASSVHTLHPGDVVATGTNHRGLSAFQDGDEITLIVEGLGTLRFNVRDDLKRTWGRDTRLDRMEAGLEGTTPQLTGKYA